ncbi:ABC transporter substrate-binding protein [Microvirga alba]|uniref:ABC transporter substrate-binding protein n=1 Tax=Microvirga alba TaxID=2791025 RepID=A0A931FP86_9HYPH|nr:ABC transporter substrate-binding protein [Microvirga alba]MBF9234485.1 ABC transporter substrate-binding protein [Microvirga alba]
MRLPDFAACAAVALVVLLPSASSAADNKITVTDVVGRQVEVKAPVEKVILGEGRQVYFVAALDTDAPFKRVVGWRDDFEKADLDGYKDYIAKYPLIAKLPKFGGSKEGTFDIEQAISLAPDVMIMNVEAKTATDDSKLIEKLAKVGIPVVFIDFRDKPFENTDPSMRLMGKLFGKEARAEEFIAFRNEQIDIVTKRLAAANPPKPVVMIERAAGYSDDCCMSFGNENFGKMVEIAGGINMASKIIPGTFGVVNPEQIIAADPDQVIVTGSNWELYVPGGAWVGVGPGANGPEARRKLSALMERPAFTGVKAVKNKQVHAVWHQFYNSPYQFVAIQAIAKWQHPDLFKDLDPHKTMRTLHERFLPVTYKPGYWASLTDKE